MAGGETLRVQEHRRVGADAYLLRLSRPSWTWKAGQLLGLSLPGTGESRDYTIASGEQDDTLDVLYRLIPHGLLTPRLVRLSEGDTVQGLGPYGTFTLRDPARPLVFCATGTGVAPCRAFLRTHPGLSLVLLHGARCQDDLYFAEEFSRIVYHPCTSREQVPGRAARITELLPSLDFPESTHYYLCGANEMIYEVQDLLAAKHVPSGHIFHEPYYYRADL